MGYKDAEPAVQGSYFNEAGFQIQRLHDSWRNCYHFRVNADFIHWRWELEYIWSELCSDAKRLHSGVEWKNNKYNILISGLDKLIQKSLRSRNASLLYKYLDVKEKVLKKLQDDSGKGGSYKEERDEEFF